MIVGMADSIHLARWLRQFKGNTEFAFRLVSSSPHRRIHPIIRELCKGGSNEYETTLSINIVSRFFSLPLWMLDRILGNWARGLLVAYEIVRFKPHVVHANELQNAGYAVLKAFRVIKKKPVLFTTNYGSELYWFKQFPRHRKLLQQLLQVTDFFSAECLRDFTLARELGYKGSFAEKIPVSGGLIPNRVGTKREYVAIKGYENKWGKALSVIRVLEHNIDLLEGYKVVVFSANRPVIKKCRELSKRGYNIVANKKNSLSHSEIQQLLSRSLCYVGYSLSDGISTSMLEAMANGAIPIQTDTSCANEWIVHQKTGFLVNPEKPKEVLQALKTIISGDFDVALARRQNYRVIERDCSLEEIRIKAIHQYQQAMGLIH